LKLPAINMSEGRILVFVVVAFILTDPSVFVIVGVSLGVTD
jgi:hypothetical protein